jgi:hypothetical protein
MITPQLERLKQDIVELDYFVQRLQKEGSQQNSKRLKALELKRQYLQKFIENSSATTEQPEVSAA